MYFPPKQFYHLIGRADGIGWSAATNRDEPGYMVYGPYTAGPTGHQLAYFLLNIDNNTAYDHLVAVLDVVGDGKVISARTLYRKDFAQTRIQQIFGVPFHNPGYKQLQFRVYWLKKAYLRFEGVKVSPAGVRTDLVSPMFGLPSKPKQWHLTRSPQAIYNIWVDPALGSIADKDGRPLFARHEQMMHNIGRVCGLAFKHVPHNAAQMRFHYGTPEEIEKLSIAWNSREWFGTRKYGSVYLAVHPNRRDVWTGSQLKKAQGGGRIGRINATRFAQHALWTAWGWQYHDPYSPNHAARNANMSGDFRYPTTGPNVTTHGLAGFDWVEIDWLRKHYGGPWLGIYEAGL